MTKLICLQTEHMQYDKTISVMSCAVSTASNCNRVTEIIDEWCIRWIADVEIQWHWRSFWWLPKQTFTATNKTNSKHHLSIWLIPQQSQQDKRHVLRWCLQIILFTIYYRYRNTLYMIYNPVVQLCYLPLIKYRYVIHTAIFKSSVKRKSM